MTASRKTSTTSEASSSWSSTTSTWSTTDTRALSTRRPSHTADYSSASYMRTRTDSSASSYLCDDDLLCDDDEAVEIEPRSSTESEASLAPIYHCGEDGYRQRKAMQEQRRREAMKFVKVRHSKKPSFSVGQKKKSKE